MLIPRSFVRKRLHNGGKRQARGHNPIDKGVTTRSVFVEYIPTFGDRIASHKADDYHYLGKS